MQRNFARMRRECKGEAEGSGRKMARNGMIFDWIDEETTPDLLLTDRAILLVFTLGITRKDQLFTITNWSKNQLDGALKRIRNLGKTKEEKDAWLRVWRTGIKKPYVYSLGKKGNEHARLIREEPTNNGSIQPLKKAQISHFLGINDILCRLLQAGLPVDDWMASKEVQSVLYHEGLRRQYTDNGVKKVEKRAYVRPDGWLKIGGKEYFVEYDNATKTPTKLKEQLKHYLDYSYQTEAEGTPVLWVVPNEKRKELIERLGKEVLHEVDQYQEIVVPTSICFVAGEEVEYFKGNVQRKPFWEEN